MIGRGNNKRKEVKQMPIYKTPFEEPAPEEITEIIKYGNKIDLKTKKYNNSSHIQMYEKYSKTEMLNTITGETIRITPKDKKVRREVISYMKGVNHIVEENLLGQGNKAMLIKLQINEEIENKDGVLICKRFWEKLKRKLPKETKFIRVLIYHKENIPEYEYWIISPESISIDEKTIKALWEDGTKTAKVITPVTKEIIEKEAQYYKSNKTNPELYKPSEQILGMSKGIKRVSIEIADHKTAKEQCSRHKRTFESRKRQVENINNVEQEVQVYTYETYEKEKITIKLKAVNNKRYIRRKTRPTTKEKTSAKVIPKKKTFKEIEQETQEIFTEIGQEVQKNIRRKKK